MALYVMLDRYGIIYQQFTPLLSNWNKPVVQALQCSSGILQYSSSFDPRQKSPDKHLVLIEQLTIIFTSSDLERKLSYDSDFIVFIFYSIVYLYVLTMDSTLVAIIKGTNLAKIFLQLATTKSDLLQQEAYRILAMIMTKDEVKSLSDPENITRVFTRLINNFIDNMFRKKILQNTLLSLKSLAHCQIIPLIMKEKYKPDGWLGFIVSGRLYIDFPKMTFDNAYERLKSEILQHRSRSINGPPNKQDRIEGRNFPPENKTEQQQKSQYHDAPTTKSDVETSSSQNLVAVEQPAILSRSKSDYTYSKIYIELWTEENVQEFLCDTKLDVMLPLCQDMDGQTLYKLYKMCLTNTDSMYQSLKSELLELHKKTLPISGYLRFIKELKKYAPIATISETNLSIICSLM